MATSSTALTMAEQLVPDKVWAAIESLLPPKPPHPTGGRPWIGDRAVLGGIISVPRAGVPWRLLPDGRQDVVLWFGPPIYRLASPRRAGASIMTLSRRTESACTVA